MFDPLSCIKLTLKHDVNGVNVIIGDKCQYFYVTNTKFFQGMLEKDVVLFACLTTLVNMALSALTRIIKATNASAAAVILDSIVR